jgi:hypothetical protein
MDAHDPQRYPVQVEVAEPSNIGRVMAVSTIALWLLAMLLVMGPAALRGLF